MRKSIPRKKYFDDVEDEVMNMMIVVIYIHGVHWEREAENRRWRYSAWRHDVWKKEARDLLHRFSYNILFYVYFDSMHTAYYREHYKSGREWNCHVIQFLFKWTVFMKQTIMI